MVELCCSQAQGKELVAYPCLPSPAESLQDMDSFVEVVGHQSCLSELTDNVQEILLKLNVMLATRRPWTVSLVAAPGLRE